MPNYHITRDDIKKYKGNPNGAITPDYIGQLCIDDLEKKYYISTNLNNNGWVASSEGIDVSSKQDKTDNSLSTADKTITGAINELKAKVDETFQEVDNGKNLIATSIGNPLITGNSTFSAMSEAILGLRRESENTTDAKEILYNMMIEDGYNEATSSMTVDELIDLLDRSDISVSDIKQIACGGYHTFILKTDGSIWGCGDNGSGQLGLNDNTNRNTFTQVTRNINNDVKQIACGQYYTYILKNDGSVWSCGTNGDGQLGLGDTTSRSAFTKVTTNVSNVKEIVCGYEHTFMIKNDGSLWACGYNGTGQLGSGSTGNYKTSFTQVTTNINNDVKQIACGMYHTFILKNDGSVWCCGISDKGQLGLGDDINKSTFTQVTTNVTNDVKQIACGYYDTFLLKNDGSVWATGINNSGELGLGDTSARTSFTKVTTNINNDVKQIACGDYFTYILKNDGSVWACGYNNNGQLGLGDYGSGTNRTTFTQVTKVINNDVKQISCGDYFTFILKNDGSVWSCGSGNKGQLGLSISGTYITFTNIDFSTGLSEYDIDRLALYNYLLSNDIEVTEDMDIGTMLDILVGGNINNMILGYENNLRIILTDEGVNITEEDDMTSLITKTDNEFAENTNKLYNLMVEGGYDVNSSMNMDSLLNLLELSGIGVNDIRQIACGDEHTVILKTNGSLYSCGYNTYGQLGLGDTSERTLFTRVTTNVNNDVKQIACGANHTFILKNDGSVWCCGGNTHGQLGLGDDTKRTTFTQVTINVNNDIKQIACGQNYTVIIKNDGSVWSCGYNNFGQLGLGSTATKNTFTQVTTNVTNDVEQIACGYSHTFILKNNGSVWACGYNGSGQLGLGNTTNKTTFAQVTTNVSDVKEIVCGQNYTFILKNDGSIWSCGYNNYGQLGLGTTEIDYNTFTKVTTNINNDVKQIACGEHHTVILKNDGSIWSCGRNDTGQLGISGATDKNTFTQVITNINNDVKQVACGGYHTFILKADGSVWACGYNYHGQLGLNNSYETGGFTGYTDFTDILRGL